MRERPDEPAFLYFDTAISRRGRASTRMRSRRVLRDELGLQPGDRVALMLQNVPQLSIAVHAVWHSGAIVTTVNPMYKERELAHQFTDAGVRVVICLESLYASWRRAREARRGARGDRVRSSTCSTRVPAALAGHERLDCPGALRFEELAKHTPARASPPGLAPGSPAFSPTRPGPPGCPRDRSTRTSRSSIARR